MRSDSIFVHADVDAEFNNGTDEIQPSNVDIKEEQGRIDQEEPQFKGHHSNENHKPWLKAECSYSSDDEDHIDMHNNPFTKLLMNKLGPQFDPTNLYNKNKKMFQNLAMLDGLALCADNEDYERTYLDQIKIASYYENENFNDKPSHIGKLFANEDKFLDGSYSNIVNHE